MKTLTALAVALLAVTPLAAATPPNVINYQGVLRDAAGNPSNGSFDMVFRLFDQQIGGSQFLSDSHLLANGLAVSVTNGLFSVEIGSGLVTTAYPTLSAAFGAQGSIWLEIQVNAETLTPRLHFASAGYALNAGTLEGQSASGFVNTSSQSQTKSGILLVGTAGSGPFASLADTGYGVIAKGSAAAGSFSESDTTAKAELAKDGVGVTASGPFYGAYFGKADFSAYAYLGNAATGIQAYGATSGGYFRNTYGSTAATLAATDVGSGSLIESGARFEILGQGTYAVLAYWNTGYGGSVGIYAHGAGWLSKGGWFDGEYIGVAATASVIPGTFSNTATSNWAELAPSSYKIHGSGSVAFVQNHPTEKDRVIVYNAAEGDEVATYTRGSARLVGGEVHIPLGETFAWVTNPDLGLTAYVTPMGGWADLYVAAKSTKELVVRSREPGQGPIEFDYIVYGLRIGFEEASIVQEKKHEAFIPSMADHRKRYEEHQELRRFNALERMKVERGRMGLEANLDLSASAALRNAIHEYDPALDAPPTRPGYDRPPRGEGSAAATGNAPGTVPPEHMRAMSAKGVPSVPLPADPGSVAKAAWPSGDPAATPYLALTPVETLRVSESVHAGELLAIDPLSPESVRRAEGVGDPRFVGIAAQDSESDQVVLATTRIVRVQADATFGAIAPGDLLTTSPSAGLAMRAVDAAPGAVFGKALDPLEGGTGEIRVLWMPQ
jgi:hypothetical protein